MAGRQRELDRLRKDLDQAHLGPLRALVLEGEPGIGKTRLVREALSYANTRGFTVLHATAEELDQHQPFGLFNEMVRTAPPTPERDRLRRMFGTVPDQGRPGGDEGQRLTELLAEWVEAVASRRPVVLVVEDLHWADASSLSMIGSLVRRLRTLSLAMLCTLRPIPRARFLDRLLEQLATVGSTYRLGALDDDAVVALTTKVLGAPPGARLREQISGVSGNPLFLLELLRALRQQGAIGKSTAEAEISAPLMPPDLRTTLLRRYSFLADETLEMLRVASILGSSFALTDLAAISGRPPIQLMPALHRAIRAGLLEEDGAKLAFRHHLVWQALYEDMPVSMRKDLHRAAGRALATAGATVTRIAEQFWLGARDDGGETAQWLRKAARASSARSTPVAVQWYERALELVGPDDPDRIALTAELAPLLVLAGRLVEAEKIVTDVVASAQMRPVAVRLQFAVAHALTRQGRWQEAREKVECAAASALDEVDYAIAMAPGTYLYLILGEVANAVTRARACLAVAEGAQRDIAVATSLMTLTLGAAATGALNEAIALGRRCVEVAARPTTSFVGLLMPHVFLGRALTDADRLDEAERSYQAGIAHANRLGGANLLPYYHAEFAILRMHAGDWDDAWSEAEASITLTEDIATPWRLHALALLARVALSRGALPAAAQHLAEAEAEIATSGLIMGCTWVRWAQALLLEAQGRGADAVEVARRAWDCLPELRFLHSNWLIAPDLVRLAMAAGDVDFARRVTEEIVGMAPRFDTYSAAGAALRCRALVEGDHALALAAVEAYGRSPRPTELAFAREQAAIALAGADLLEQARPLFTEALAGYESIGATHHTGRIIAIMRALGIRKVPRRARPRATNGWSALTPTELTVAGWIAEGLPNSEIARCMHISRYTVETHLKHIFTKLDLTSRAALAVEVERRGARLTRAVPRTPDTASTERARVSTERARR